MDWETLYPNFSPEEFECRCAGAECIKFGIQEQFVSTIQRLRDDVNFPLVLNSAYRCKLYNASLGSKDTSQHVKGLAVDISTHGLSSGQKHKLLKNAFKLFNGVGIYKLFIHVDLRPVDNKAFWLGEY